MIKTQRIFAFGLAAASLTMVALPTQSFEFFFDVEGSFDSQLSVGSSWRLNDADPELLKTGNNNDGNANFEKGDVFSQILKGNHTLQLRVGDSGLYLSGKYWHDFALEENQLLHGHSANNFQTNEKLNDENFNELSKFSGAALMDAYVYSFFEMGEVPVDVRLGRQVVSWGESTFILGGVNSINPVDVNAFRRPGAEIKEGLLPVNMFYANMGLTETLSAEVFYQLEFQETVIPGCGTYFAFNDYAPEGCDVVLLDHPDPSLTDANLNAAGFSISRDSDGNRLAADEGQYGIAFRYIAEALGDAEIGLYAMNIHSRLPLISGIKATGWQQATSPTDATHIATAIGTNKGTTHYYVTYPEDIQLVGLSFSTNIGSVAVSGEVSHKKDLPIQINATMLLSAGLTGWSTAPELMADVLATADGDEFDGYRLFDVSQAQFTVLQFFDRMLGASRYTFIGEVGYTFIHDFDESATAIKFGRPGIFDGEEGYVTESSWGYRGRLVGEYNNVFSGVTLKPMLAWSHDVEGYAPQPGGAFVEGAQSLGLSLTAEIESTYTASLSYTDYMGGDYNVSKDRDLVSISLGAQF